MRDDRCGAARCRVTRVILPSPSNDRRRAFSRALPCVLLLLVLTQLAGASYAWAHATVRPGASRPADLQIYTLTVPNERRVDTDAVSLKVPAGINFLLVRPAPGWTARLEKSGDLITVVRWSGGRIPPDFYDQLQFIARNPVREGTLVWKVLQRYADGRLVRWVGTPGSDTPASQTKLSEQAVPQDIVSVHGEKLSASLPAPTPTANGSTEKSDDDSDVPLILAIVALAAGLGALGLVLLGRRNKRAA
jgi:uncharacterized protein YcnI